VTELPEKVLLTTVNVPLASLKMAPPWASTPLAVLPERVL
jgi:hypothetical protein